MICFRQVTRDEYLKFVRDYPRKLEFDVTGICEPPIGTYSDATLADKWPDDVVAKESRGYLGPTGEFDPSAPGKYWEYFVRAP